MLLTTITFVAGVLPMLTIAPAANPLPLIVTFVPPLADPVFGEMEVTVGGGPD